MKKVWFLVVSLLLIGILPAGIYLVGRRQDLRNKAAPATTLAVTPATLAKKVGDTFTMEVTIDTGENQVVAAEIDVTFDPTKLSAESINNGTLFSNILASGTIESGAASITVGASNAKEPVKGTGTVAVIRLKALAKTESPTAVKLASNTFVGGLGEGATNVLVGTTPATVTITESQTTPRPTLTPPASPAPQATGSATPATASAQTSPPASPSATLAIVSPTKEGAATVEKPTIKGKAAPGAIVTITIYSTPRTVTVTADGVGNWSYTPDTPLESGPHSVVASVTDQTGQTQTATTASVVASSEKAMGGATECAIPVSGTVETTLLLLMIGGAFVVIGLYWSNLANWAH